MKKTNKILSIGLFIAGLTLMLKHFQIQLPDSIYGLCLGTGIGFELIGIYSMNHDISRYRNLKLNILRTVLKSGR